MRHGFAFRGVMFSRKVLLLAALFLTPGATNFVRGVEVPAFPGAEGAGAGATGGRGGTVVHVRNLNATGPGSLADAVSEGDRIIVFDVSGVIDLASGRSGKKEGKRAGGKILIDHPNITIAGQTAPGEGICLKGGCLTIAANNVIVRHLRSRRGWLQEGDMGDAIEAKGKTTGEAKDAGGQTAAAFDKRKAKKESRGKFMHEFAPLTDIVIDHCSASWGTDENLSCTHVDRATVSWSIAAEGCDYTNPKQTPPNHSEGSLWGSGAPDGRSTMHHVLYAHNRLRNPRTTGGPDVPPVLNFYNNVVYDWSEYASHTGSERVLLNWINNYYRPGPSTPADIRGHMFEFHGDPGARIFAAGNMIDGSPDATADNRRAIFHNEKFRKMPAAEREAMKVAAAFGDLPPRLQSAEAARDAVLADAGATLPARDAVDWRVVESVRGGGGKVIGKETDFPEDQRWPDYRSLAPPRDSDGDGLPDFWERQFSLDPGDATDAAKLSHGYANIEHYINNTDPTGNGATVVFVSATVSRARAGDRVAGEWRVARTGDIRAAVTVRYSIGGDAREGRDYGAVSGTVTIPAGKDSAVVRVESLPNAEDNHTAVISLEAGEGYGIGCPARSLVVIRR